MYCFINQIVLHVMAMYSFDKLHCVLNHLKAQKITDRIRIYSNWLIAFSMWLDLCLGVHFAVCLILNWIVFDSNHFWLANTTTCVKWCLCTSIAEGACDCVCVSVCVLSHFLERSLPDWYVPQTNCMYAHCWVYQSLQRTLLVFFLYHTAAKVLYLVCCWWSGHTCSCVVLWRLCALEHQMQ